MKSKSTAALLALLFGGLGVHRFYLGRPVSGFLYLFFCWTFLPLVLSLVEAVVYACESEDRFNREFNREHVQMKKMVAAIQTNTASNGDDTVIKLERLAKLRETGVLSEQEFEEQKKKALA